MTPLSDRVVILSLVITVLVCFGLAFWSVRLAPPPDEPILWRTSPASPGQPRRPASPTSLPPDGV